MSLVYFIIAILLLPVLIVQSVKLIVWLDLKMDRIEKFWRGKEANHIPVLEMASKSSGTRRKIACSTPSELQALIGQWGLEEDEEYKAVSQELAQSELKKQGRTQSSSKKSRARKSQSPKPTFYEDESQEEYYD